MTQKKHSSKLHNWKKELKELVAEDKDLLKAVVLEVVQDVLEAEMEESLQAEKGERTSSRLGYRSGYYSRSLITRVGKLELRVPQDRQGRFRTEVFERYQRSEKEGESNHRGTVRPRIQRLDDQPNSAAAGQGAGEVRAEAS